MKKLRILILGASRYEALNRLIYFLKQKGHYVIFISMDNVVGTGADEYYYIKISPKQKRFFSYPYNIIKSVLFIKKLKKNIRFDISHSFYIYIYGLIGILSGLKPHLLGTTGSDVLLEHKKHFLKKIIIKYVINRAEYIIAHGDNIIKQIKKFNKYKRVIKNNYVISIDTEKFKPQKREHTDKIKIISNRKFYPIYNLFTLIKAAEQIIAKDMDIEFILAGTGVQEESLKEYVGINKLENHIKFIGYIEQDEMPEILSKSDIYVSTALSDGGIPASLLEAMACGLLPITTNVADIPTIIKDGENGFLFEPKNYKQLAEKIEQAIKIKEKWPEIGKYNRKIVKENFEFETEMKKLEKLYYEIVKKNENSN